MPRSKPTTVSNDNQQSDLNRDHDNGIRIQSPSFPTFPHPRAPPRKDRSFNGKIGAFWILRFQLIKGRERKGKIFFLLHHLLKLQHLHLIGIFKRSPEWLNVAVAGGRKRLQRVCFLIHCHLSFIFLAVLILPIGDAKYTGDMRTTAFPSCFFYTMPFFPSLFSSEFSPCGWYGMELYFLVKLLRKLNCLMFPLNSHSLAALGGSNFYNTLVHLQPDSMVYSKRIRLLLQNPRVLDLSYSSCIGPLSKTLGGLQSITSSKVNCNLHSDSIFKCISNWRLVDYISVGESF